MERLFARHKLGAVSTLESLSGGQLNTVVRVNHDWVLRCREATRSTGSLKREAALLPRLAGRVPVAEVVAVGMDELLGEYVVQRSVPGKSLLEAWSGNPDVQTREWWLVQWAASIHALHEERLPAPGTFVGGELRRSESWRTHIEGRIRKRLDQLMRLPASDRDFILAAERFARRLAPVLEDGPCCLIHRDLHFGNVLVNGPHLAALLDFELAEAGPPDYELDTIYRFLRYPWLYGPPELASRMTPARLASVWMRVRRGYPAMFAAHHLRERLSLYALDHDLSCLVQGYSGRWGTASAVEAALARIREILRGEYGPE